MNARRGMKGTGLDRPPTASELITVNGFGCTYTYNAAGVPIVRLPGGREASVETLIAEGKSVRLPAMLVPPCKDKPTSFVRDPTPEEAAAPPPPFAHGKRRHTCRWPGCTRRVPPALWGCAPHWSQLPAPIRKAITEAFAPSHASGERRPSHRYVLADRVAQDWIRDHERPNRLPDPVRPDDDA